MNKHNVRFVLFVVVILLTMAGCGPAVGVEPGAESAQTPAATTPALENVPDSAGGEQDAGEAPATEEPLESYPSAGPATPTTEAGYPAAPVVQPTIDPYPGGVVWVLRPVGVQCAEGTAPGYGDLRESRTTLMAAGVRVVEVETVELMVTTSCGSPTSAHYRAQIAMESLDTALSLGWTQE